MNEGEVKKIEKEEIPKICTFRGLKPEVFKRAHKKAQELESSGKVLLLDDWKEIVSESWKEVKEEVKKICSCVQPISEKSEGELTVEEIQEDMQDGQYNSEEDPLEREPSVEQVVDAQLEQTSAEEKREEQPTDEK